MGPLARVTLPAVYLKPTSRLQPTSSPQPSLAHDTSKSKSTCFKKIPGPPPPPPGCHIYLGHLWQCMIIYNYSRCIILLTLSLCSVCRVDSSGLDPERGPKRGTCSSSPAPNRNNTSIVILTIEILGGLSFSLPKSVYISPLTAT